MILHTSLGDMAEERSRQLRMLIRQGKIMWGGNRILGIYGRLRCASGRRMKDAHRVFFGSEAEARSYGYRPCGHCMRPEYLLWKRENPQKMQADLFAHEGSNLLPYEGETLLYPHFFSPSEADSYFQQLLSGIPWKQEPIRMFGKEVMQPRLTAWYGDEGKSYSYSGIRMEPLPWTEMLDAIRQRVSEAAGVSFNSALLNLYRDGRDSMGWHRDNEKELGKYPVIGSVSFGVTRKFQLRSYKDKSLVRSVELMHGSFLLMRGETQHHWEHRIPKSDKVSGSRINITFRIIC